MNKIFKGLLATAIALSGNMIAADHSNKTFLMPRPGGSVDLPMETTSWCNFVGRDHKHKKNKDKGFGGNLNITGFYNSSECGKDLGKYFGPCCKADCPPATTDCNTKCPSKGCSGFTFSLQRADARFQPGQITSKTGTATGNFSAATDDGAGFSKDNVECLDLGYIIHNANFKKGSDNKQDKVTLGFNPEHDVYGVRFDYYQDLECLVKGLFMRANLPIVKVENNLNFAVCSQDNDGTKTAIQDYFKGNKVVIPFDVATAVNTTTNPDTNVDKGINQQEKLCKAKICGKQSESGVADIDLALGYKFLNKEDYHAALAFAITIPTGNTPDGKWLFEPVVGNGGHFGLGFDFDGGVNLWDEDDQNLKLYLRFKYRYLFEDTQHRVLGLGTNDANAPKCSTDSNCNTKCPTNERPWGHYHLLGCAGTSPKTALVPAANVLCLKVDVEPGSQFDGVLGINYNYEGFNIDLGYNLYWREAESVKIKGGSKNDCNTSCETACPDLSIYSIAARGHITANAGTDLSLANVQASTNSDYLLGKLGFPPAGSDRSPTTVAVKGVDGSNVPFSQTTGSKLDGTPNSATQTAISDAANAQTPSHFDGGTTSATAKLNDGTKLVKSVAETPSQLTHSIYGGLGYAFLEWDYPVLLRIGAKYEWKDDNASIKRFGFWGGIGIGF